MIKSDVKMSCKLLRFIVKFNRQIRSVCARL